jgi:CheY-like chemotaxis protein
LHGGQVEVFSDGKDCGSTFTVRLPLSIAARQSVTTTPDQPGVLVCPPELEGVRVLIVDDEADARELLEALFVECKALVVTAAAAEEGLVRLREFKPDVLISDIGMPEQDGYVFISKVRSLPASLGGRTPAIALTAYARTEDRARVLLSGFQSHVAKPVEPLEILALAASLVSMRRGPD